MRTVSKSCWSNPTPSRNLPASLYFRSGNAVTALEAPGLAEITAAVVRTGTAERTSRQIEEDLRRMGADFGTSAGADTSAISFSGLAEFSSELLVLVSELAQQASFPAEEFERERRQMIEGLRIERTTPSFLASERLRRVLFGEHPYAMISPTRSAGEAYRHEQLAELLPRALPARKRAAGRRRRFFLARDARRNRTHFRLLDARAKSRQPPNPPLPELRGRHVHFVHLPEACRRKCCSAIAPSRASIPIGCASAWRIRFTAERSIRAW